MAMVVVVVAMVVVAVLVVVMVVVLVLLLLVALVAPTKCRQLHMEINIYMRAIYKLKDQKKKKPIQVKGCALMPIPSDR